jgi:hypothetical protein
MRDGSHGVAHHASLRNPHEYNAYAALAAVLLDGAMGAADRSARMPCAIDSAHSSDAM